MGKASKFRKRSKTNESDRREVIERMIRSKNVNFTK